MRIGFACKIHSGDADITQQYNFNTTTVRALSSLTAAQVRDKLHGLARSNLRKLRSLVEYVSTLPEPLRMVRLSGDVLPLYTYGSHQALYSDIDDETSSLLAEVGGLARLSGTRISFHPGQFVVLGSNNAGAVNLSLGELHYHGYLLHKMGYQGWHQDGCVINIHAGSKNVSLDVLRRNILLLEEPTRNFLSIENDEFSRGIAEIVDAVGDLVPVVMDLHHHWVMTGEYLRHDHPTVSRVVQTWRGVRPKIHCAMSREEHIASLVPEDTVPQLSDLLSQGLTRSKLRQHSDTAWNRALCEYYSGFVNRFDIMVEAKHKQQAAEQLYRTLSNSRDRYDE